MQKNLQNTNKLYRKSYQTLANSLQADQQQTIKEITQIGCQIFGHDLQDSDIKSYKMSNDFQIQDFSINQMRIKNNQHLYTNRKSKSQLLKEQYQKGSQSQRNYPQNLINSKEIQYQTLQQKWISLYHYNPNNSNKNNPESIDVFKTNRKMFKNAESQHNNKKEETISCKNFSRPIGNFKKKFIDSLPKKTKQEQQLEYIEQHQNKSLKSLNEFYEHNKSLYDKFIEIKQKKQQNILKGFREEQQKQMQGVTFKPKIIQNQYSKNIPSFQSRQKKVKKQKQINKIKIQLQMMQNHTFEPQINKKSSKNNVNIQSKIKSIWKKQKIPSLIKKESIKNESFVDLKGISQSMIKTGSFFSQIVQEQSHENQDQHYDYIYKQFPIRIKDPINQLQFMIEHQGAFLFQQK